MRFGSRGLRWHGKQKDGLKVHTLTDIHADSVKFVKMSEARMHDKKFLQHIDCLSAGCMLVFDKAYNFYQQFAKWTENGIKTQVWATLIAHLLLTVLMRKSKTDKTF
jgi:hypothetical protein